MPRKPPEGGTALPPKADPYAGRAPIANHRLLGDGCGTALLRANSEVDWWCAPSMDDPPLAWCLLDEDGAAMRWLASRAASAHGRIAAPSLESRLQTPRGPVETKDGLLRPEGRPSSFVRLIRGLDQDLDVWHELALGGFDQEWVTWQQQGAESVGTLEGRAGTVRFRVLGGERGEPDDRTPHRPGGERWVHHRLRAPQGEWTALVVTMDPHLRLDEPQCLRDLTDALDRRDRHAEQVVQALHLPKHLPHRAEAAVRVVHACTYAATGAVVASPTTSLPEAPGFSRNFDYRYSWLRDASAAVAVSALLGWTDAADDYLDFVVTQTDTEQLPSGPMTDIRGKEVGAEREVDGVAGWGGSRPVLVGNGASQQVQYDAVGLLIEAVHVHVRTGGRMRKEVWKVVRDLARKLSEDDFVEKTGGIWEVRDPLPLVSADIGIWLALDRAVKLARIFRPWTRTHAWKVQRDAARDRVIGALEQDGGLPQAYPLPDGTPTGARSDASALLAVIFGMFDADDPRAARLVDATLDSLDVAPFVYRYEPGQDDGFEGMEGAFLPCSWWAVSALAKSGRLKEARARAEMVDKALPALMPEEVDPESREGLGNMPLVWAHVEAARAAYLLDDVARQERWGTTLSAAFLVARYLRHRPSARRRDKDDVPSKTGRARSQNRW